MDNTGRSIIKWAIIIALISIFAVVIIPNLDGCSCAEFFEVVRGQ